MASIVVNGDTSGSVTLSAPATAGSVTVTLPATSGTMLTTASSTGVSGSAISSGTVAEAYGGTGTNTGYYGFKNRIINGAMVIDQRNAGASVTSGFPVDRFSTNFSVGSKFTLQRSTTAPAGFSNSLLITSSSAYSIGAGDYFLLNQTIEGFNIADLNWGTANAVTATLSFWVRASLTGTYSVNLQSGSATTVNYLASYTVNSANTWEFKTITLSAPTSGGFPIDNSAGVAIRFTLGAGSSQTGATSTWATSGVALGATGQVNLSGTNGATFYITGVQLEKGSTATSFDYRPYGTELALCQRYCSVLRAPSDNAALCTGANYSTTNFYGNIPYPVTMRTTPSLTVAGTTSAYQVFFSNTTANATAVNLGQVTQYSAELIVQCAAVTAGTGAFARYGSTAGCVLTFSSEL